MTPSNLPLYDKPTRHLIQSFMARHISHIDAKIITIVDTGKLFPYYVNLTFFGKRPCKLWIDIQNAKKSEGNHHCTEKSNT